MLPSGPRSPRIVAGPAQVEARRAGRQCREPSALAESSMTTTQSSKFRGLPGTAGLLHQPRRRFSSVVLDTLPGTRAADARRLTDSAVQFNGRMARRFCGESSGRGWPCRCGRRSHLLVLPWRCMSEGMPRAAPSQGQSSGDGGRRFTSTCRRTRSRQPDYSQRSRRP